ncbi:unnamed protein product [Vitrella brassicaformis CCMP3155]|uniref:Uncharacterized protein n=1 Tax=Vitrella brassicaformis (strain CCMP3155) TaxID=1169540 RepID=A0A0G4GE83_VITBC|nr:unnamed protein product [Vitrella brassicaformis CCMP3155]|eukprot:CEM27676.1 unnamed protein product [Vitrella brassicaformis CCMP3155]
MGMGIDWSAEEEREAEDDEEEEAIAGGEEGNDNHHHHYHYYYFSHHGGGHADREGQRLQARAGDTKRLRQGTQSTDIRGRRAIGRTIACSSWLAPRSVMIWVTSSAHIQCNTTTNPAMCTRWPSESSVQV